LVVVGLSLALAPAAVAKKGGGGGGAPNARAVSELAGKFKWGMSAADCFKVITDAIAVKYADLIKKEPDTIKQDALRREQEAEQEKVKQSKIVFDGQKSGWDTSIVDKEFTQRNGESMIVMWEKDQRRFLFFWNDKLYKQFIAFNAEHPVFAGKSFDDFANIIQNRYGQAEMKFSQLRTKDDMTLDHLEWPASGDYQLWAIDQSGFYGNYCLKLQQPSVVAQLQKARDAKAPKRPNGNALIDAVTAPAQVAGDKNADIVDEITGKRAKSSPPGSSSSASGSSGSASSGSTAAAPKDNGKKKKKEAPGESDPLEGMKY
jgi:hypothetical protein